MAKRRTTFVCRSCGAIHARWMGKCPTCGEWDMLEEHREDSSASRDTHQGLAAGWHMASGPLSEGAEAIEAPAAMPISEAGDADAPAMRIETGIGEFDRVLGGGVVPGSAILLGGDPGIGKSTILLQALGSLAARGVRTLYVSAEESAQQVRLRAERLRVEKTRRGKHAVAPEHDVARPGEQAVGALDELYVLADTNLARIVEQARQVRPAVMVVDSIQMIYRGDLEASPGSIAQLRRCATDLVYLAKLSGVAVVLVGHVTKEGALAGPRLLEHLVDVVLYFEGDRYHAHRVVRSVKNRFGTTLEIGLFEMTSSGLREAPEGASVAAGDPRPGSAVCPVVTGSRCMLVEVQALTASGFPGALRRRASGIDSNRLAMLIAVLEQHAGLSLHDRDVFASAVGGVRVGEPAADLALVLAIAGSHQRRALRAATAVVGEVGLGGEVRPVPQMELRVREAARLGYSRLLCPRGTAADVRGIELVQVRDVGEAIAELGGVPVRTRGAKPRPASAQGEQGLPVMENA